MFSEDSGCVSCSCDLPITLRKSAGRNLAGSDESRLRNIPQPLDEIVILNDALVLTLNERLDVYGKIRSKRLFVRGPLRHPRHARIR